MKFITELYMPQRLSTRAWPYAQSMVEDFKQASWLKARSKATGGGHSLPITAAKSSAHVQTPTCEWLNEEGLIWWAKDLKRHHVLICRKSELSESSDTFNKGSAL